MDRDLFVQEQPREGIHRNPGVCRFRPAKARDAEQVVALVLITDPNEQSVLIKDTRDRAMDQF